MPSFGVPIWKKAPFIRLLLPLIAGILTQHYFGLPLQGWYGIAGVSLAGVLINSFIPLFNRFRFAWLNGIRISCLFISMGALITWAHDLRNDPRWIGHHYKVTSAIIVTIAEQPVAKANSYKTLAKIYKVSEGKKFVPATGSIILYFQKDTAVQQLTYGSRLIFKKPLQVIKNTGNPGGFDYRQYCFLQGISHQVNLKAGEFELLPGKRTSWLKGFLLAMQERVLNILSSYIPGKEEPGLAEALLIGYKDDLDKDLVRSYSNTGVVHIIAISGLHIGLIYWLIILLLKPLQKIKGTRWLRPIIIIISLWLFSLLAGAQPSVLRSAVMFTCIVVGDNLARKSPIFNTLAFSAFILLCYNPYWLWDVGFQLSYVAVLSLVIFMQPVYNWFYIKNKTLDFIWKLNAVTIGAQILTLPLTLYYFHQFPNLFLFTNFVAVPLSSIIVLGEILLCAVSFAPPVASITGNILSWLIRLMNSYIERIDSIPFSTWNGIQISFIQAIALLASITGVSFWLLQKKRPGMVVGVLSLLAFASLRSRSFYMANHQKKIVIYSIPRYTAMDILEGRTCSFWGDTALMKENSLINFYLKPARSLNRVRPVNTLPDVIKIGNCLQAGTKKIMLIENSISFHKAPGRIYLDLLVISKNPRLFINDLAKAFTIKQIVFDASAPAWKVSLWKKDCDSLHIKYHDTKENGAFVMNLR